MSSEGPAEQRRRGRAAYPAVRLGGKVVRIHRYIMEAVPGQEVHHIDGDAYNYDPSNLVVCSSHAEHMRLHANIDPCRVPGCDKGGRRILGLCENHYRVWKRRGTTDTLVKHRGRWEK